MSLNVPFATGISLQLLNSYVQRRYMEQTFFYILGQNLALQGAITLHCHFGVGMKNNSWIN